MVVWERFRSSFVSLKCEILRFRSQIVLLFPSVNGEEGNFMVTIDNAAYSIVGTRLSKM